MANFIFSPAKRENVSLLIGLVAGTGGGKTMSADRLAVGMSGGKRFAVIDTEAGRAKHYADQFSFDHGDLKPPFTPAAYMEAIVAADTAGYPVIIVDSASHVWAGDGGVLEQHESELQRMAGNDWQKREACKMAAWIAPKMAHKKMVSRLLQLRAHVILCLRAEEKIEMVRNKDGKLEVKPKKTLTGLDGWVPICEKHLPFELTASFLLTADAPGIPKPIKLEAQHRPYFDLTKPIDEKAGERLAEWARGGAPVVRQAVRDPEGEAEAAAVAGEAVDADQEAAAPWVYSLLDAASPADVKAIEARLKAAALPEAVRKLIRQPLAAAKARAGA